MGKGFENYMSKKWFHPTNVENMKRVFMAEQKSAGEKKRQQDLREQYEREQEVFSNKQLMGDEKSRLGLAFMYNAPAGYKDNKDEETKVKPEPLVTIDLDADFKPKLELPLEQNITMDLTLDDLRDLSRRDKKYFLKRIKRLKRKRENL